MQTSQVLKITTPANENQADFGRKDTKIKADLIRSICATCARVACPREYGERVSV